ncbi:MAG: phosphatase PAP2 family protein [Helicobacter sp.]|nr:phosphatase PAP2 family protein [Helicobacter sp.]
MFKIINFFIIFIFLSSSLQAQNNKKSGFQIYGDIFQFLPFMAGGYALFIKDYDGLKDLAIASGATALTTTSIKLSFVGLAKRAPDLADISKRPDSNSYDGFPSGHTSFAFSGAGFLQSRYGSYVGLPAIGLASLVGISRVYAKRHSLTQVLAGAVIGFSFGYFLTNEINKNIDVQLDNGDGVNIQVGFLF